jgi:predicted transposase YdaD
VKQEKGMEAIKLELVQKMEEKGITVPQIAEAIQFDPHLLALYLAKDAYPVPKRIMEKLTAYVNN